MNKNCLLLHVLTILTFPVYSTLNAKSTKWKRRTSQNETFLEYIKNNQEAYLEELSETQGIPFTWEQATQPQKIYIEEESKILYNCAQYISNFSFSTCCSLACGTLFLVSYGYARRKLNKQISYLNNTNNWSSWKRNLSCEEFYEIPEENLSQELLNQIVHFYGLDKHEVIEALHLFIKDAKTEITKLQDFINFYRILKLPVLSWLFPNHDDEFILAQESIERLSNMLDLVNQKAFNVLISS